MLTKYLVFLFFLISFSISAQRSEWLVDTIFRHSIKLKDATILYNSEKSILIDKEEISPFHSIQSHISLPFKDEHLVQIDDMAYILNEDLSINFDEGLVLNFSKLSKLKAGLEIVGKTITYAIDYSVFVDNFEHPDKTFITEHAEIRMENEKFLTVTKGYPEEVYIYNINTKKLNKLPTGFGSVQNINPNFVLKNLFTLDNGYKIDVFDINTNKIIDQKEGYQGYVASRDLLAVFEGIKPSKFWYKGKSIKLPPDIVKIELIDKTNLCVIKNKKGKYGIMDPNGKMVQPLSFDKCNPNYYFSKMILAKKGNHSYIFTRSGKEIFEGKYHRAEYLCADRFSVETRQGKAVVNTKGDIIIPFMRSRGSIFSYRKENDRESILWITDDKKSVYSLDGKLILEYTKEPNSPRSVSESYMSGYPLSVIRSMNEKQLELLNPLNLWKSSKKVNDEWYYSIENNSGKKLTAWFRRLTNIKGTNTYIAKTKTGLYGVIKVEN